MKKINDEELMDLINEGITSTQELAKHFNCCPRTLRKHKERLRKNGKIDGINSIYGINSKHREIKKDFKKDNACVTVKSLNIRTVEDALKEAEIELGDIWEVDRYIVNSWEVTMGKKGTDTDKPETYTNWQVKIWLKRKVKTPLSISIKNLENRIKNYAPDYKKIKYTKNTDSYLLELCLFDIHFGLLAWEHEVGKDYDLDIAENFYKKAIEQLIKRTSGFKINKILLPVGQDFFHINNPEGVTPRNRNNLDVDSRLAKVFEIGKMAVIKGIDLCRGVAPVEVLWVPGNHDPETSYYLVHVLSALYHKDKSVNVDTSPKVRKHFKYGNSFIGYTHGSDEKEKDLPRIFMDEFGVDWATAKSREIHIGHKHIKRKVDFVSVESFGSTTVRMIPSLCSIDSWHYRKGYVGGDNAAMSFLWDKNEGMIGSFLTKVK